MKILTKIIVFAAIFVLLFSQATYLFRNKDNAFAVAGFYTQEENSLDVLFMGTSRILNSMYPLQLWNKYGMASYNLAQHAQTMSMTYYAMKDVMNRQNPKVIVLDTYFLISGQKISNSGYTHKTIDNMPWSVPKVEALADYVQSEGFFNVFEYIVNLSVFHSRWKELEEIDFEALEDDTYGAELRFGLESFTSYTVIPKEETAEIDPDSLLYLNKIIDLCKENSVELILLTTPCIPFEEYGVSGETQMKIFNSCYELAEEKGITYINLMHHLDELNFNFTTDMYNEGHVNPNGGEKLTEYIGAYIKEHYDIPDHREDMAYADWDLDYERYMQYQNNFYLKNEYDLTAYLDLLKDNPNYIIYLSVQGSLGESIAPEIAEQLKELGLQKDWSTYSQESYLAILDGNTSVMEQSGEGVITYEGSQDGIAVQMSSDKTESETSSILLDDFQYRSSYQGLGIVVYDKTYGEVVDQVVFDLAHGNTSIKK